MGHRDKTSDLKSIFTVSDSSPNPKSMREETFVRSESLNIFVKGPKYFCGANGAKILIKFLNNELPRKRGKDAHIMAASVKNVMIRKVTFSNNACRYHKSLKSTYSRCDRIYAHVRRS